MGARDDRRRLNGLAPVAAAAAVAAVLVSPASAGAITVTTKQDEFGTHASKCSLREAVRAANDGADFGGCKDSGDPETIKLSKGTYRLTIDGAPDEDDDATGDLDVKDDVQIKGAGSSRTIVDGHGVGDRVLSTLSAGDVTLSALTMQRGGSPMFSGGGISSFMTDLTLKRVVLRKNHGEGGGGGVTSSSGSLTLIRCKVIGNTTGSTAGGGVSGGGPTTLIRTRVADNEAGAFGGGVYINPGALVIRNSTITGNRAEDYAGGIAKLAGSLEMSNSRLTGNEAGTDGGAVHVFVATVDMTKSVISGNRAIDGGGGAFQVIGSSSVLNVNSSTINANRAGDDGGAFWVEDGQTNLTNSTISGNSAKDNGGGIAAGEGMNDPEVDLKNVTIADNVADSDQIVGGTGGGIYTAPDSGVFLTYDSIIGDNTDKTLPGSNDCATPSLAVVYSLVEDLTGCDGLGANNIFGQDPKLKPLADNGGPTKTHALKPMSPARNTASAEEVGSTDSSCDPLDQRGVQRPQGAGCDMGAFELKP